MILDISIIKLKAHELGVKSSQSILERSCFELTAVTFYAYSDYSSRIAYFDLRCVR